MASRDASRRAYSSHHHFASLEEYVKELGGNRVIRKVLIANNGIGAVKAIRSMRRWAYETFGNEREVLFVSMATPEDLRANAEYIRMADEFVEVPGGSNANNYANVNLIVQIAQRYKVDAVWAGWGHASENPALPRTLMSLGLVFIGPPAEPMYALGDKIGSTIIAQSAQVPTIAWNGQDLTVDYAVQQNIPKEVYEKANVKTAEQCMAAVEEVGLPVMIKASEGGGGKGIRKVVSKDQVEAAFRQVQGEIPGSPIFVMKLAPRSRHLEVQLLADVYGNAIALSGRDCSIQRRHQKILEEGPPLAASPEVWDKMCKAAVRLAKEVGYVNAGTVEYLYYDEKFFFLELNPRLQVEHPVTEMITYVNLPAAQLNVAMGIPLDRITDIRKLYNREPYGSDNIDFDNEVQTPPDGHVIAARITAENPYEGFTPTSGPIQELNFRSSPHVWGYFSVDSSGRVHEFADSQIGHLFSWGENREEARRNLVIALHDLSIRGDIRTTVEYLQDLLEAEDYRKFNFDTSWLDERIKANVKSHKVDPLTVVLCGAACQGFTEFESLETEYLDLLKRGQLPPTELLRMTCNKELIYESVKYCFQLYRSGTSSLSIACNGTSIDVEIRALADGGFLVLLGGKSHVCYVKEEVGAQRFVIDGQTCLFAEEYDPTRLRAQMGGKLLRFLVADGAHMEKGAPFAEIEVMKMNMQLFVKESGTIKLSKPEGSVMEPGDLICTMELDDPSKVKKARLYENELPALGEPWPRALDTMPHNTLESCRQSLGQVMDGYCVVESKIDQIMQDLNAVMQNPMLPILEIEEILARIKNTMPYDLVERITQMGVNFRKEVSGPMSPMRRVSMSDVNLDKLTSNQEQERQDNLLQTQKALHLAQEYCKEVVVILEGSDDPGLYMLKSTASQYTDGFNANYVSLIGTLMKQYLGTESIFADLETSESAEKDDVLQELRREYSSDLPRVFQLSRAHASIQLRNYMMMKLLAALESVLREEEDKETKEALKLRETGVDLIQKVGTLAGASTTDVSLEARQLLIELNLPSHSNQIRTMEKRLRRVAGGDEDEARSLIDSTQAILHLLIEIVSTSRDDVLRRAALETYIRRLYNSYVIDEFSIKQDDQVGDIFAQFTFHAEAKDSFAMNVGLSHASSLEDITTLLTEERSENETGSQGSSSVGLDIFGDAPKSEVTLSSKDPSVRQLTREARAESATGDNELLNIPPYVRRQGSLSFFSSKEAMEAGFNRLLELVHSGDTANPTGVMHVILKQAASEVPPEEISKSLKQFLGQRSKELTEAAVRRVTVATAPPRGDAKAALVAGHGTGFYTFRHRSGYAEDRLVRDIETPLAFQLQLQRLANFNIALVPLGKSLSMAHSVQVYSAVPKAAGRSTWKRFFVRALVRQTEKVEGIVAADAYPGPERVFVQALCALEALKESNSNTARQNHIFLNILGDAAVDTAFLEQIIRFLTRRYADRLRSVGVSEVELKLNVSIAKDAPSLPIRVVASNPTGHALRISRYVEATDPSNSMRSIFYSVSDGDATGAAMAAMGMTNLDSTGLADGATVENELHGKPLSTPYAVATLLDEKRARSAALGTAYAYDFPTLFERSAQLEWKQHLQTNAVDLKNLITTEELVLDDEMEAGESVGFGLCRINRAPGNNSVSMLVWKLTLKTPQYPEGRPMIVIANDITNRAGSFGTREDEVFKRATLLARHLGIPRIYIAANSGARIGMADEVKRAFKVKWTDADNCNKGFQYIYITEDDYKALGPSGKRSLLAEYLPDEKVYKVTDIIGEAPDLGVENLRGSGTIAGETSRAYDDIFTLTYVSGRTVGIGAYLVRLGQRTIQKGTNAPILLTGYQALNSLMGREVYSSNLQLGGTKVMYNNGVSHQCVRNDLEGVQAILKWLSYVPLSRGAQLPQTKLVNDVIDRDVDFDPSGLEEFDPRWMLAGLEESSSSDASNWRSGFFDRNSFTEYLAGWAKSVVIGRARLGEIPMGVIISETRTMEATIPADPANPDSKESSWQQAGQVWFPDSAYKTAQAISDFNKEDLPLMLFANWRGFSGGQRDMYDEVLKYGSFIVDELVAYEQPIFIYIPPTGQLRGGAWVVVDPTINDEHMEMYVDKEARGGVLEPSGAASIKFRQKDILATIHRLDPVIIKLNSDLKSATPDTVAKIKKEIASREELLFPVYKQISLHFADLHDRPGRMMAKGVVKEVVEWKNSRRYFYKRLRRKLLENKMAKPMMKAIGADKLSEARAVIKDLCMVDYENDDAVYTWLASSEGKKAVEMHLQSSTSDNITKQTMALGQQDAKAVLKGLMGLIGELKSSGKVDESDELVQTLRKGVLLLK